MNSTVVKTVRFKPRYDRSHRTMNYIQSVNMTLGLLMILIGLCGLLYPQFMGMNLPLFHSLMFFVTGGVSIYMSRHSNGKKLFLLSMGVGVFLAIHALLGFYTMTLEDPQAAFTRYLPGFNLMGIVDHSVHAFLALFYFTGAYSILKHGYSGRAPM